MSRRNISSCVVMALAVLAIVQHVCADPNLAMKPFKMTGQVTYPDGRPATDATAYVYVVNKTTHAITTETYRTDPTGTVSFTIDPADFTTSTVCEVISSPSGCGCWSFARMNTDVTSVLAPFTSVRVRLVDRDGKPVAHAKIGPRTLADSGHFSRWSEAIPGAWSQTTDNLGYATFTKLPQGYSLNVNVNDDRYALEDNNASVLLAKSDTTPDATVTVAPAASISGTVVFGPTNKPAAGVEVLVFANDVMRRGGTTTTNASGAYTVHRLIGATYTVTAADKRGVPKDWVSQPQTVSVASGSNSIGTTIRLIHGGLIMGRVTDTVTGLPVPDIDIAATPEGSTTMIGGANSTSTGRDGTYSLRILPCKAHVSLYSSYAQVSTTPEQIEIADGETKTINFQIAAPVPPSAVHVTVVGPDGKPVPAAQITAFTQDPMPQTLIADALGCATFDSPGLPPNSSIVARAGNLATTEITAVNGESQITLHLAAGSLCTLKGSVTGEDGSPIPNAPVSLIQWRDYFEIPVAQVVSDARGQYVFPSAFGNTTYTVQVSEPGYATAYSGNTPVTLGQTIQIPAIVVKAANSIIAGTVVDAAGKPVANATVNDNDIRDISTTTDQAGRFIIKGVPGGKTMIAINELSADHAYQELVGGSSANVIVLPTPVNGIVLGPDGKPVSGADVTSTTDSSFETVETDDTGHFTMDAPGLKSGAKIVARSGNLGTASEYAFNGESPVTLHLTPGALSTIKGVVTGADAGPVANATVTIMRYGVNSLGNTMETEVDHAQCDASGRYAFPASYNNAKYVVCARAKGYGIAHSNEIVIGTAQTVQIPALVLRLADSFVGGTVVNAQGKPVANIIVTDADVDDTKTTTDQAGHFLLNGVPRGKTDVEILSPIGTGYLNAISGRADNVVYLNGPGDQK